MTLVIPSFTQYEIERGDRGLAVWAVQRALNKLQEPGEPLAEDAIFGGETETLVVSFQEYWGIGRDGVFGQTTSRACAAALAVDATANFNLPMGLERGVVEGESGGLIAAVNITVPGGVDCGYTQRRVYEKDYGNEAVIQRAFDGLYQMTLLATTLQSRHDKYFGQRGAKTHLKAWRLATLYHNYPTLADKIAVGGVGSLSEYYRTPQSWVQAIGARFPDGVPVQTPLEWGQHYALANPAHDEPGQMFKYVAV